MHIMEKSLEAFHYVSLCLLFGNFRKELSHSQREKLFLGSSMLLEIFMYLTDPCPLFVLEKLRNAINSFKKHIDELLEWIKEFDAKNRRETTKMHAMAHMCDQLQEAGAALNFTTKLLETFHFPIKDLYRISSKTLFGSAQAEVLESFTYSKYIDDALVPPT